MLNLCGRHIWMFTKKVRFGEVGVAKNDGRGQGVDDVVVAAAAPLDPRSL